MKAKVFLSGILVAALCVVGAAFVSASSHSSSFSTKDNFYSSDMYFDARQGTAI